jgi:tetratricopeptide (TPR) repeat protein
MVSNIKFAPDRSRPDWRDIPVSLGAASHSNLALEATLPSDEGAFEIRGEQNIEAEVAGAKYLFDANLSDNIIRVTEKFISNGGEIAPESFREERRNAAALARNTTKLVASDGMVRRWRYALEPDRSALQPLEEAFAQLVANDPDEVDPYLSRAAFRFDTFDFAGALEDMNAVIELEATAEYYGQRSNVHAKLLDLESSISDREEAYSLDPSAWRAMHLARELIRVKEFSKAREILEYEDGDEQVRQELNFLLAELDALDGDAAAGLARLDEMLADKPNDSTILNSKCWFMATWSVDISDGISVCTKAVENSGKAASILDSRAMIFLRNGMLDEALSDIQAGLDLDPGLSESVLLRGLIRLERGDEGGQDDIKDALARDPDLALTYRRWGFDL